MCIFLWSFNSNARLNLRLQTSQGNGRFSLCITMCTVSAPFDTKASPHIEHANGRSPVWILRWISILHLVKIFPQNSHLFQLLPLDFLSCFVQFSLLGEVNLRFFLPTESVLAFSADLERREISINSPIPPSRFPFLRTPLSELCPKSHNSF